MILLCAVIYSVRSTPSEEAVLGGFTPSNGGGGDGVSSASVNAIGITDFLPLSRYL